MSEPFHPNSPLLEGLITQWFHYVTAEEARVFQEAMRHVLEYDYEPPRSKRGLRWLPSRLKLYRITKKYLGVPRPVLKDPIAAFSSEWLAKTFHMDVVCIVRHPAAFVLSLKKVGWGYDYRSFLRQKELIERWLYDYVELLSRPPDDVVEAGSVLWLCIYAALKNYVCRNPDWQLWRLEDISLDPEAAYRTIYASLGLPYKKRIVDRVKRDSGSSNPIDAPANDPHLTRRYSLALREQWRTGLTPDEALRIRNIVEPVACQFYEDKDW